MQTEIVYPSFFERRLSEDRGLRSGVDATAQDFGEWMVTSRLPFFSDYTEHGIDHLNSVLATTDSLIADEARDLFTPGDTATLVLATLLHDAAMHISEAGFDVLMHGQGASWSIKGFLDEPWGDLWDGFLFSARRWDDQTIVRIIGDHVEIDDSFSVQDPFSHYDNLTSNDRRLIGEFIRRHHHRMAHEFAVFGIPGPILLQPNDRIGRDIWDIAGLVARSHGMPVRTALDYLQGNYHRREYKGIHAVFLMALLRISDQLQIHSARAPRIAFKYKHIPSRTSRIEWQAHAAVTNITQTHDDPESLEIQAMPRDVLTFLRLRNWLSDIQHELDASWAVLGEVYGSHHKLRHLGLILRRVRSNLDDLGRFSETVEYVPQDIQFEVTRPDLLKLLVRPLYHDVPSYGVRELIQNAVDAVRERWALEEKHPELRQIRDADADVEVRLDDLDGSGCAWLSIRDQGVGMTVETVRDFFLRAGASLRTSDAWKKDFEIDGSPRSVVLRSGRFGVGLLAGFLLGPRMEVATRHVRADRGIHFSTSLTLEPIEIRYDCDIPVGTTIRIPVSKDTHTALTGKCDHQSITDWYRWFIYDRPAVRCVQGCELKTHGTQVEADQIGLPSRYRRLGGSWDYGVFWTYQPGIPALSVNGLFVNNRPIRTKFTDGKVDGRVMSRNKCIINHPNIIIEDKDGGFPLDLRRTDITTTRYPFEDRLMVDIVDDFLAYLIVRYPSERWMSDWQAIPGHPGVVYQPTMKLNDMTYDVSPVFATRDGLALTLEHLNIDIEPNCMLIAYSGENLSTTRVNHDAVVPIRGLSGTYARPTASVTWLSLVMLNLASDIERASLLLGGRKLLGMRVVVPERWLEQMHTVGWQRLVRRDYHHLQYLIERVGQCLSPRSVETIKSGAAIMAARGCPDTHLTDEAVEGLAQANSFALELFLKPYSAVDPHPPHTLVGHRWQQIIQNTVIPFNETERLQKLSHAFQELGPFIEGHAAMLRARQAC